MTNLNLTISQIECPTPAELKSIEDGLEAHNEAAGYQWDQVLFSLLMKTSAGEVRAGLNGYTLWGWLYVRHLWVSEELRGQGIGGQLILAAEKEALKRGCHSAYLDTFTFQAPGFYQKLGYRIFGELDDFPKGAKRHFLYKNLSAD